MGLRKPAENATAAAAPEFEDDSNVAVAEQPEVISASAPDPVQAPASTSNAISAAKPTAVAIGAKYKPALEQFKNQIDPSTLDFDTFPRVTVGLDGFSDDKKAELGKKIVLRMMSWNERYIVTPGKDDEEANALVKYSLDGKTIDGTGESVADYIKMLKEVEGYTDAACKKYYSIYGFMTAHSKEGQLDQIDPAEQPIVSIQVPPRSVSLFTRFQIEHGVKVAQGIVPETDLVLLTQEKTTGKTKAYASIKFSPHYES